MGMAVFELRGAFQKIIFISHKDVKKATSGGIFSSLEGNALCCTRKFVFYRKECRGFRKERQGVSGKL
jgi:hypothetical protein